MKLQKTKNTILGSIFGILNKFILIIFPFIIRTIIINYLGAEYTGLNGLFSSILEVLSLAELGFGSAMVFNMYKPIAEENPILVNQLLSFYKKVYLLLGSIILIIGLAITPAVPYLISGYVPNDINVYLLFIIYLLNSSCSYFALAYRSSLLIAHQRNDIKSNVQSICLLFMYAIQIIVLVTQKNYYLYIIFTPIFTIITNLLTAFVTKKYYPQYKPEGNLSPEERKKIKELLKSLIGHKLGAVVLNATDNIVISAFLGLTMLAIYGNYYYIMNAIFSLIYIIFQSMVAGIANSIIINSKEHNKNMLFNLLFAFSILIGVCSCCFAGLYQIFMRIWVGEELMLHTYYVILFILYFYIRSIRYVILSFKDACGMWKADFLKPYIESIVNLVLNILLVYFTKQLWGIIVSSVFSMLFIALPWETNVLFKNYFEESPIKYYLKLFFYLVINAAIISLIGFFSFLIDNSISNDYISLIIVLIFDVFSSILIETLFFFKTKEFQYWKNKFIKKKE